MAEPATRLNVRRVTSKDAWEAGRVLAASHADYPAYRHCFPRLRQRRRVLTPSMTAAATDVVRRGEAYLARISGIVAGAALWLPPGTPRRGPWDSVRVGLAMMPVVAAARTHVTTFARVGAALARQAESEDGWYLQAMGVDPRHQGRGIGSRLLAPVLEAADAHGVTCGLHTSDPANVSFYERFGFTVVDPLAPIVPDGPSYLRMRRQPH